MLTLYTDKWLTFKMSASQAHYSKLTLINYKLTKLISKLINVHMYTAL